MQQHIYARTGQRQFFNVKIKGQRQRIHIMYWSEVTHYAENIALCFLL